MTVDRSQHPRRLLDPMERISEVLFGLIMVLTLTGSISAADQGRAGIRAMLIGAVDCNLAWGIIDGVMYLMAWPRVLHSQPRSGQADLHAFVEREFLNRTAGQISFSTTAFYGKI